MTAHLNSNGPFSKIERSFSQLKRHASVVGKKGFNSITHILYFLHSMISIQQ